ncbi:MAG TPA: adenylate/guanylate cyclase domain-containing protein [bacterium]
MRCPRCGFDNPPGTNFCGRCGSGLQRKCPSCGTVNPEGFAFCGTCGTQLTQPARANAAPAEERKVVTVLFADLTDSTPLTERLDPEQTREIMTRFFEAMGGVITQYGGTLEKFIGDEIMAVFGLPAAHEDDPARAVQAAAAMHERLHAFTATGGTASMRMRIGINTGEVVANPAAAVKGEFMVTGDSVNVAARLRSVASPDGTVVGERTYRDAGWVAEFRPRAPLTVKGKREPVAAWDLVQIRAEPQRRDVGLSAPLVGRDEELALLRGLMNRVTRERRPHLLTIFGAAGVGKTRLFEEFAAALPPAVTVRQGRSLAYGSTSMWPVGEILRADCGILRTDSTQLAAEKLRRHVGGLLADSPSLETAQITTQLGRVLAIRGGDPHEAADESREGLFWALRRYVEALAKVSPLVLVLEDLHSGDPELLDLVEHIAQRADGPILIVGLARREMLDHRPTWGGGMWNTTALRLEPLDGASTQTLLAGLLRTVAVPAAIARAVSAAEGNPFFMEEILRMLIDTGALQRRNGGWDITAGAQPAIPDTVQGVVTARLDRLVPRDKSVLQEASVLGKEFWSGALQHLTGLDQPALDPSLDVLQQKDFLVVRERSRLEGQQELSFKHIILRDVAYGMMPKARRTEKHRQFGAWLEQLLGPRAEEFAELLAYHWSQAAQLAREVGRADQWADAAPNAMRYALMAGQKAARVFANDQAVTHFRAALAFADELGSEADHVAAVEGLADVHALQAEWGEASRLYQEALDYHRGRGDASRQAMVQSRIGSTFSGIFDFRKALPHIQDAIDKLTAEPHEEPELATLYVQMARTQAYLGNLRDAERFARDGLRIAEQHQLLPQVAEAHGMVGWVKTILADPEADAYDSRYLEMVQQLGDVGRTISAMMGKSWRLRMHGDYHGSLQLLDSARLLAEQSNNRPRIALCHFSMGSEYLILGKWPLAIQHTQRYLAMGEEVGSWHEHARSELAFVRGDLDDAFTWAQRAVQHAATRQDIVTHGLALDWCGWLSLRGGHLAEGHRVIVEGLNRYESAGSFWPAYLHPLAAEIAMREGSVEDAVLHYRAADDPRWAMLVPARARLLKVRGLVAAAEGSWDSALAALREAADLYRSLEQPYELALCLEVEADVIRQRDAPGDAAQADLAQQQAMQIYAEIGAKRLP